MGPLQGLRIVEFAGIGPAPFAAMVLADLGADVLIIDRKVANQNTRGISFFNLGPYALLNRGKRTIALDLKQPAGVEAALRLVATADALIEGFRPGVMERNGLGPDVSLARNPRLVYGRMTGWGQDGPLAARAGHDINYIALSGALHAIGPAGGAPVPPLNLVGDFGGGGMQLGFGIACALFETQRSGRGQVIDAAMVEGASLLTTMFWGMQAARRWSDVRGDNILDSGTPWYDTYRTSDGQYIAIGAIEPKFYAALLERMDLARETLPDQHDRTGWPALRTRFAATFATKTRDEWCRVFEGSDACFAPVLSFAEAARHPHALARQGHVDVGNVTQPAPAPRLSRTPGNVRRAPPERGALGREALADWGFADAEIAGLAQLGVGFGDR